MSTRYANVHEAFTQQTDPDADPAEAQTSLADITTFEDLQGLLTNHKGFIFKLQNIIGNTFSTDTYDQFFAASADDYLRATHAYKDAAEISAVNMYLSALQNDENERLKKLNDKFRNNVLTTKQMYMMVNRDAHKIRSNIRIIMYALVLAAVVMALMPSHQTTWAKVLIAIAILAYFTYAVLHVRRDKSRRFTDFSKYFFQKGDVLESKADESKDGEDDEDGEGSC